MLTLGQIQSYPLEQVAYKTIGKRGQTIEQYIPLYHGEIVGLPSTIDALVIASDLQGVILNENTQDSVLLGTVLPEYIQLLLEVEYPHLSLERTGVLLCGDLYTDLKKRGASGNSLSVWQAFQQPFGWVVGVDGNHDLLSSEDYSWLQDQPNLHHLGIVKWVDIHGLKIAGLGGIIGRTDRPNRLTEIDYTKALKYILAQQPDLLLLHQSPDDPILKLEGSPLIRQLLEQASPTLVCCGHSYWEQSLITLSNQTQVLNADSKVFIWTRPS